MADGATTVKLADVAGDKALVLNATATDDRLRAEDCRANHRSMRGAGERPCVSGARSKCVAMRGGLEATE